MLFITLLIPRDGPGAGPAASTFEEGTDAVDDPDDGEGHGPSTVQRKPGNSKSDVDDDVDDDDPREMRSVISDGVR